MIYLEDMSHIQFHDTAVALGKFDGIHRGHLLLVEHLAKQKVKGLTSVVCAIDMGKDSILSEEERKAILEEYGIDYLVHISFTPEFAATTPEDFIRNILVEKFHARDIVVGTDFRFGSKRAGNVETLEQYGRKYDFQVTAVPKLAAGNACISSTRIRGALAEGDLAQVKLLLGRAYSISGIVQMGRQLGRTIGFPTVNLAPPKGKLLPGNGVYASYVYVGNTSYKAITNIGNNPTIDSRNQTTIESYLFDFDGDLYGAPITVVPVKYIRGEQRFSDVTELKKQLISDISFVKDLQY
jgi:riboflavin kinase/FMN adenylyltransferase